MLFNPNTYDPTHLDAESRRLLRATIDWSRPAANSSSSPMTSTASGTRSSSIS